MGRKSALDKIAYQRHLEALGYPAAQAEVYAAVAFRICEAVRQRQEINLLDEIARLTECGVKRAGEWVANAEIFFMPPTGE